MEKRIHAQVIRNRTWILLKGDLICAHDFLVKIFSSSFQISEQANKRWFNNYAGHLSNVQLFWDKSKYKFGRPDGSQKIESFSLLLMFFFPGIVECWSFSKMELPKDISSATKKRLEHSKNQKLHRVFSCFPPLIGTWQNFFFKLVCIIEFQVFISETKVSVDESYSECWHDSRLWLLWRFVMWNIYSEYSKSIKPIAAMPLSFQFWNRDLSSSWLAVCPDLFVFWCCILNLVLWIPEYMLSI